MSPRGPRLQSAAEIGWLLASTTLLILLAIEEPGVSRGVWLVALAVNATVVGYRLRRVSGQRHVRRSGP